MSQRELTRLEVIQRVKRKTLKQRQAAELLGLSVRQVKRLCKAYQGAGAAGLISKRRGQPSNNHLPEKTINKARRLLRARYYDFGPTLAAEKLAIEGVSLSVETVRQRCRETSRAPSRRVLYLGRAAGIYGSRRDIKDAGFRESFN